jgi:hypothetical protein
VANQIINNTGIKQDEYQLIQVPETKVKSKRDLSVPFLFVIGLFGMLVMIVLLAKTLSPKQLSVTPTLPPIKEVPTKTPVTIAPTRKITSDRAIQTIFDAESSADAAFQSDFTEQKLIPPVLDMSIKFEQ